MKKICWLSYIAFIVSLLFISCRDDSPSESLKVNKYISEVMEEGYFWNSNLPNVNYADYGSSYNYFDTLLSASFDEELNRNIDQWSFLTNDYQGLLDYFSGVRKSMGHSFRLGIIGETNNVAGIIEYVEPESPAAEAGLERGMMFYKINNQNLTIYNYSSLLNQDSYTMTFGVLNNDYSITPLSPSVQLAAIVLQTNPIHISKVIEYEGKKIGYLMYKSFIDDYDDQLESVFADFKSQGVTELVLDLRYNGGGAVSTAILLSSMIAPSSAIGDVFINLAYNQDLMDYYSSTYPDEIDMFTSRLEDNSNNLNLNRLVVLTTYKTASASEMVMYGLSPFMTVYHIGEQTHGKYYASQTIHDEAEIGNWALQPIVLRVENKDNSIDYRQGLLPNLERKDLLPADEYYPLGDIKEDFLALALEYLTGVKPTGASLKSTARSFTPINKEYKISHPLEYDMRIPQR